MTALIQSARCNPLVSANFSCFRFRASPLLPCPSAPSSPAFCLTSHVSLFTLHGIIPQSAIRNILSPAPLPSAFRRLPTAFCPLPSRFLTSAIPAYRPGGAGRSNLQSVMRWPRRPRSVVRGPLPSSSDNSPSAIENRQLAIRSIKPLRPPSRYRRIYPKML